VEIALPDLEGRKVLVSRSSATQSDLEVPVPPGRRYYDSSAPALNFSTVIRGALLASDTGVGKTIQLIGLLNLRPEIRRVLIICPVSVKLVWRREFENWLLPGRTMAIAGDPDFEKADIWIINYEQLAKYQAQLRARRLDLLVCDESHYIKSPKSQRSKLTRALGPLAARRILMTGTPVLNKPAELWAQLNLIDPVQWPKFFPFATRYCDAHRNQFGWDFSGAIKALEPGRRVGILHLFAPQAPEGSKFVACVTVLTGFNNRARLFSVHEKTSLI
jgi:SNF2 domain-containing protein